MSKQAKFGSSGTVRKLETLAKYADFYTTALKDKGFRLHYFDGFAGTGTIPIRAEAPLIEGAVEEETVVLGSAQRALQTRQPFHRYVFVEKGAQRARELDAALASVSTERRALVTIERDDANAALLRFCDSLGPMDRALVFLDPFGNQVAWETLVAVAATGKIDLWYLFPCWLGVTRQIKNSGEILAQSKDSIDRILGPHDWEAASIKREASRQGGLFDPPDEEVIKIATAESMTRFMIENMNTIFRGGVLNGWLPVGKDGRHWFSLLFACANPSAKANRLAINRAQQIMRV